MARRIPLLAVPKASFVNAARSVAMDFGGPARTLTLRVGKASPFHQIEPAFQTGNPETGQALLKGHFQYAGQSLDVGQQGDPWTIPAPSERFATWLHSFAWLEDLLSLNDAKAHVRARFLIDRWISVYGKWNPFAWRVDVLSTRLYHWLTHWTPALNIDHQSDLAQTRRNVTVKQLKRLRQVYRRSDAGLPRLTAACVMVMGGLRLSENADSYHERGLDWLDDEIDEQILPDGGHISRSPEKTLTALRRLLMVDDMLRARGISGTRTLSRGIDRLSPMVSFFRASDGGLVCFNGSGETKSAHIDTVLKATNLNARPFGYGPHTHYQRVDLNGTVLMLDSGTAPPLHLDTDAHLAPLALEISTDAGRLIVNCGWSEEQPQHWRSSVRSTAAHSTLVIDDMSAGRLLKPGFSQKQLGPVISQASINTRATRKEQTSGVWLESSHDGYKPATGLAHRRRIYMDINGHDIRGEDSLAVPIGDTPKSRDEIPFDIRFHLHPDVKVTLAQNLHSALLIQPGNVGWRFRTDSGPLSIESSTYLGTGNRPVKCEQLVISGKALCDSDGEIRSNRVRWSIQRLDAKS